MVFSGEAYKTFPIKILPIVYITQQKKTPSVSVQHMHTCMLRYTLQNRLRN